MYRTRGQICNHVAASRSVQIGVGQQDVAADEAAIGPYKSIEWECIANIETDLVFLLQPFYKLYQ